MSAIKTIVLWIGGAFFLVALIGKVTESPRTISIQLPAEVDEIGVFCRYWTPSSDILPIVLAEHIPCVSKAEIVALRPGTDPDRVFFSKFTLAVISVETGDPIHHRAFIALAKHGVGDDPMAKGTLEARYPDLILRPGDRITANTFYFEGQKLGTIFGYVSHSQETL